MPLRVVRVLLVERSGLGGVVEVIFVVASNSTNFIKPGGDAAEVVVAKNLDELGSCLGTIQRSDGKICFCQ